MAEIRRLGILTGGGDAPGLNAVIRAAVRAAERLGVETLGVFDGFEGLLERRFRPFSSATVRDLLAKGGTVLGTSNRCNPFSFALPDGTRIDRSVEVLDHAAEAGLEALVVIGGDGTLQIARQLADKGLRRWSACRRRSTTTSPPPTTRSASTRAIERRDRGARPPARRRPRATTA